MSRPTGAAPAAPPDPIGRHSPRPGADTAVAVTEVVPEVALQGSLLDAAADCRPDPSFSTLTRVRLDGSTWVDVCRGWLAGSDTLFDRLLRTRPWRQRETVVYDVRRPEPRLTSWWSAADALPEPVEAVRGMLSGRYGVWFDSVGANLYRDGRDSVAWHRDRVHRQQTEPLVATLSLGAHRRFALRRRGTTRIAWQVDVGRGDLLVMGGRCQHGWEHTVPKTPRAAGPRMAVTLRHTAQRALG